MNKLEKTVAEFKAALDPVLDMLKEVRPEFKESVAQILAALEIIFS